jgi:LmbE family N-acetylglucosaminyl deacetylase
MPPLPVASTKLRRFAAPVLLLAATAAFAQHALAPATDPANLTGERVSPQALADTLPINHGAPALAQLLKKLRTRASLMMIVAHPDDEDSGMLTYESRGQGARVAMLTLTRGEGGQNLMSADFNDALGLIRTQELLAEDRYSGTDQFFGSVVDFGFSKTREETLEQWTHNRVLYDAVRAVRLYRPLVLTSVFIGGVTDGHGHHQVAGQINQEVFEAAADPKVFPEMIKAGLPAWAPLKVYARMPFSRISRDGIFDYATGKSSPPRFYNYIARQWTTNLPVANVHIPEGEVSTDPGMDGDTYVQFARKGLALQKTQIGPNFRAPSGGAYDSPYTRYGSRIPAKDRESSFFDGIDTSLPGIATLAPAAPATLRATLQAIDAKIVEAQHAFTVDHPEATAPPLRVALKALDNVIADTQSAAIPADQKFNVLHELRIKRVQCNNALVLALGIELESMPKPEHDTYADSLTTNRRSLYTSATLHNAGTIPVKVLTLSPNGTLEGSTTGRPLPASGSLFAEATAHYTSDLPATRPYFTRPSLEQPFYNIAVPSLRNAPETPDPLVASATVEYSGVVLELRAVVPSPETVLIRRARPEILAAIHGVPLPQPATITPPIGISLRRAIATPPSTARADIEEMLGPSGRSGVGIVPVGTTSFQLGASLSVDAFEDSILGPARIGPQKIPVTLSAPPTWTVSAPTYNQAIEPVLEHFTLTPAPLRAGQSYRIAAKATFQQHDYTESFRPVGYKGLTSTNYYTPATYKVVAVDVTTAPNLKIAYLPGTGDDVAAYLPNLGIAPTLIATRDLTPATLSQYDAVVLGVRAYAAHPDLANSAPLLDYAKSGGVVIVQYNTARYGDDQSPYPIAVPGDSAHNVVVEAQPVQILTPDSPVLTWPNKITSEDFKGWTEELGHGFASSWDPHFEALTETHDPDQDPQKGGLLYARTGRGAYVYVAFALYRQLPEGVPGAYRLFANLLSLPKNPIAGLQPIAK